MTERAREAKRAYQRKWARANPDKIRAAQARYWEKRARAREQADNIELAEACRP